jgi:hypothetical protein
VTLFYYSAHLLVEVLIVLLYYSLHAVLGMTEVSSGKLQYHTNS